MKDIIFETIEKRFLQGLLSLPCGGKDGAFGSFTDYGFEDVSLINDSKLAGIWRTAQIANLEGIVLTPNDYLLKLPNVAKKHNINIDLATLCEVSTGGNSYHLAEDFAALQERKARLRYFDLQRALNDSIKNGDTADEMSEIVQKFMLTMDDTSAATDDTLIDLNNLAPTEEDGVPLLYIGGAPALKTQNVQVITAVAGQGKSQLVKLLAGAMFRPQGIIEPVAKGGKVLIIDTEQDTSDLKREVAVILRLSGNNADNRHLEVHRFVGLSVAERRAKYVRFIRKFKPDLCIIDGISDLMADPNSMAESVEICNELKALATTCNCAILCVLHQNESADNTKESKVRGFIGSELTRKATTIFRVNSKVIDGTKIFTVEDKKPKHKFSRFLFHNQQGRHTYNYQRRDTLGY